MGVLSVISAIQSCLQRYDFLAQRAPFVLVCFSCSFVWCSVSYVLCLLLIVVPLVVSINAVDCLERLVSEMTYYVSTVE